MKQKDLFYERIWIRMREALVLTDETSIVKVLEKYLLLSDTERMYVMGYMSGVLSQRTDDKCKNENKVS